MRHTHILNATPPATLAGPQQACSATHAVPAPRPAHHRRARPLLGDLRVRSNGHNSREHWLRHGTGAPATCGHGRCPHAASCHTLAFVLLVFCQATTRLLCAGAARHTVRCIDCVAGEVCRCIICPGAGAARACSWLQCSCVSWWLQVPHLALSTAEGTDTTVCAHKQQSKRCSRSLHHRSSRLRMVWARLGSLLPSIPRTP